MAKLLLKVDRDEVKTYEDPTNLYCDLIEWFAKFRGQVPAIQGFFEGLRIAGIIDELTPEEEKAIGVG